MQFVYIYWVKFVLRDIKPITDTHNVCDLYKFTEFNVCVGGGNQIYNVYNL